MKLNYEEFKNMKNEFEQDLKTLCDKHLTMFSKYTEEKDVPKLEEFTLEDDYMVLFFSTLVHFSDVVNELIGICEHSPEDLQKEGVNPGDVIRSLKEHQMMEEKAKEISKKLGLDGNTIIMGGKMPLGDLVNDLEKMIKEKKGDLN